MTSNSRQEEEEEPNSEQTSPSELDSLGEFERALTRILNEALENNGRLAFPPIIDATTPIRPRDRLNLSPEVILEKIIEDCGTKYVDERAIQHVFQDNAPDIRSAVIDFATNTFALSNTLTRRVNLRSEINSLANETLLFLSMMILQSSLIVEIINLTKFFISAYKDHAALLALITTIQGRDRRRDAPQIFQLDDRQRRQQLRQLNDAIHNHTRRMRREIARELVVKIRNLLGVGRRRARRGLAAYYENQYGWLIKDPLDEINKLRADYRRIRVSSSGLSANISQEVKDLFLEYIELVSEIIRDIRNHRSRLLTNKSQLIQNKNALITQLRLYTRNGPNAELRLQLEEQVRGIWQDLRSINEEIRVINQRIRDANLRERLLNREHRFRNETVAETISASIQADRRNISILQIRISRDEILREFSRRASETIDENTTIPDDQRPITTTSLYSIDINTEEKKWYVFEKLLEELTKPRGRLSIEGFKASIMRGYEPVTRDLNFGLTPIHAIGTYSGHDENAVDIACNHNARINLVAPREIALPLRITIPLSTSSTQPNTSDHEANSNNIRLTYLDSTVTPSTHGPSSHLQDVYGKLVYALFRFNDRRVALEQFQAEGYVRTTGIRESGRGTLSQETHQSILTDPEISRRANHQGSIELTTVISEPDQPITEAFSETYSGVGMSHPDDISSPNLPIPTDIAPSPLRDVQNFSPDARNVIAALTFENITTIQNMTPEVEEAIRRLRDRMSEEVRSRLNLPSNEQIFATVDLNSISGSVGMHSVILPDDKREILETVREMIVEGSDAVHGTGFTDDLWSLIWQLKLSGAEPHRRALSTTIRHRYRDGNNRNYFIDVYYTHLRERSAVASRHGNSIDLGAFIGRVGVSGNSVSSHLHLTITVSAGANGRFNSQAIGSLLPHEFFPHR